MALSGGMFDARVFLKKAKPTGIDEMDERAKLTFRNKVKLVDLLTQREDLVAGALGWLAIAWAQQLFGQCPGDCSARIAVLLIRWVHPRRNDRRRRLRLGLDLSVNGHRLHVSMSRVSYSPVSASTTSSFAVVHVFPLDPGL